jgi:hypothetical protein
MKASFFTRFASILAVLALWFAGTAYAAGIPATLQVSYDFTKNIDVFKVNATNATPSLTTEFKIDITSAALGMNNYSSYGYCVELTQTISKGSYTFNLIDFANDDFFKAAWVMDQFAPGRPNSWTPELQNQAAAVQGLIWELTGQISSVANTTTPAIYTYYTDYKAKLNQVNWDGVDAVSLRSYLNSNYMFATNAQYQDLLVKVDPVPEPATMLLFGSGMLGLAGLKLRRKFQAK